MILAALVCASSHGQAAATATERLHISVFAGGSGIDTGLNSGRNVGFTLGADFSLRRYLGLNPSVEVRSTYPVDAGSVDGQRNVLAGIRLSAKLRRIHPYVDFLVGRGRIDYTPPLSDPQRTYVYVQSSSNVLSPGAGFDLDLGPSFALRADVQLQRYDSPVTTSGSLYAKPLTLGLVYRLSFERHAKR